MKVIWKRPDGFHDASPSDYLTIEIASKAKLWLHKKDEENFPFRISGGWQDEETTKKLNRLVNLLNKSSEKWDEWLRLDFSHSKLDNYHLYLESLAKWLNNIKGDLKGDTWEVEIMKETICEIERKLDEHKK